MTRGACELLSYASLCCSVIVYVDDLPLRCIDARCSELLLSLCADTPSRRLLLRPNTTLIRPRDKPA